MFGRGERILDNVLDKDIDVDLLQCVAHRARLDVRQHDEFDVCRGFVVMQLVLRGAVRDETAIHQSLVYVW